jgi:hypothetical protein
MKMVKRHIWFLFLVVALLTVSTSVVFAKELGLLTISGPGIKGEVTLKDPEAMMDLEQAGFFDQASLSKQPEGLGEGYNLTAHLNLDGNMVPFIQMVYYPTKEGQSAYIHYTARLEGEILQPVDEWHLLSLKADGALRSLLAASNITVQSALIPVPAVVAPVVEPVSEPAAEPVAATPAPIQPNYLIPGLVVGILALLGLSLLVVRRRTLSSPTV